MGCDGSDSYHLFLPYATSPKMVNIHVQPHGTISMYLSLLFPNKYIVICVSLLGLSQKNHDRLHFRL